jgi:hypothetical protein
MQELANSGKSTDLRFSVRGPYGLGRLLTALLLWSLGAGIVLALLLGADLIENAQDRDRAHAKSWSGASLAIEEGMGQHRDQHLLVEQVAASGQFVATTGAVLLNAREFPYVRWSSRDFPPAGRAFLTWRRLNFPQKVHVQRLPWSGDGDSWVRVADNEAWTGVVISLAIVVQTSPGTPFVLEELVLEPPSLGAALRSLWSAWNAFEGWSGRAINVVHGGVEALFSPVVATAAVLALSVALYAVLVFRRRLRCDLRLVGVLVLLGWVLLDARWQRDLWRQLGATERQYAQKDASEKHLASEDAELFQFIAAAKKLMPEVPQRVFVVTARPYGKDQYRRLRAVYHLLPHRALSGKGMPPHPRFLRSGDYILVIGSVPGLEFDAREQRLVWSAGSVRVACLLKHPVGRVFAVINGR